MPTLRLKLISTTVMGALMGMAGAPFRYYVTYVDPPSAFSLAIAVNAHRHADHRRHGDLVRAR